MILADSGTNDYPMLAAERIERPSRFYAVLFVGLFVKNFLLIPVYIEWLVLSLVLPILAVINSFVVLFTGAYWRTAYTFALGLMRLELKLVFYLTGLTDKYPGFGFEIDDRFSIDVAEPETPNRLYAIPVVGAIIRAVLMIPYTIWSMIVLQGSYLAVIGASFPVFFAGRYPETSFELVRDSMRLRFASYCYFLGLSDTYPSFAISWNHRELKIGLLAAGAVLTLINYGTSLQSSRSQMGQPVASEQRGTGSAAAPGSGAPQAAPTGARITAVVGGAPAAPSPASVQAGAPSSAQAPRGMPVNQRMAIDSVDDDHTALRQYFSNVELTLVSVERVDDRSGLWHFSLVNRNTSDYLDFVSSDDDAYIIGADGRRIAALDWDGAEVRAGQTGTFAIGFAAPHAAGQRYTLVLNSRAETGPAFRDSDMRWRAVEVTLR